MASLKNGERIVEILFTGLLAAAVSKEFFKAQAIQVEVLTDFVNAAFGR